MGLALAGRRRCRRRTVTVPSAPATRAQLVGRLPRALSLPRTRGSAHRADRRSLRWYASGRDSRLRGIGGVVAPSCVGRVVVRLRAFPFVEFLEHLEKGRQLQPVERALQLEALDYSPSTPRSGLRARVVPSGDGVHRRRLRRGPGSIALVERGTCFFAVKAANAEQAGAVGVLVFNNEAGPLDGTLGDPQATSSPWRIARSLGLELAGTQNAIVEIGDPHGDADGDVADRDRGHVAEGERVLLVGAHIDFRPRRCRDQRQRHRCRGSPGDCEHFARRGGRSPCGLPFGVRKSSDSSARGPTPERSGRITSSAISTSTSSARRHAIRRVRERTARLRLLRYLEWRGLRGGRSICRASDSALAHRGDSGRRAVRGRLLRASPGLRPALQASASPRSTSSRKPPRWRRLPRRLCTLGEPDGSSAGVERPRRAASPPRP